MVRKIRGTFESSPPSVFSTLLFSTGYRASSSRMPMLKGHKPIPKIIKQQKTFKNIYDITKYPEKMSVLNMNIGKF